MPKKNSGGDGGPWYCPVCGLGLTKEQNRLKLCPRCRPDENRKSWEPRYTLEQAQHMLRELADDVWHILRRLAVAELQSREVEEIGSSDVSCVVLEWVERDRVEIGRGGALLRIDDDLWIAVRDRVLR